MDERKRRDAKFFELSDRDFDLIKLEIELLERRIVQLEDLQYRLRQFSITLWLATLGFGLGVTTQSTNIFLLAASSLIPALFMYQDAWHASAAQFHRSRINAIIQFLNSKDSRLKERIEEILDTIGFPIMFPIMDLTGHLTIGNDKQAIYRKSIIVKLTRTTRIVFYGFQLFGSSIVLSLYLVSNFRNDFYYLIILSTPLFAAVLYLIRLIKKKAIIRNLPADYEKLIDEGADKPSYKPKWVEAKQKNFK